MRQGSVRTFAGLTGLGVVVVLFSFANGAAGQSPNSNEIVANPALSPRVFEGQMRGVREPLIMLSPQAPTEGGDGNPFFPDDCAYYEDYSSFRLGGLNGDLVNIITTNKHFASLGGVPPQGNAPNGAMFDRYIAVARDTLNDSITTAFQLGFNFTTPQMTLLAPGSGAPLICAQPMYLASDDDQPRTSIWWSPVSFTENSIQARVFYGGTSLGGLLGSFENEHGVLDRFVNLHIVNQIPSVGTFYAPPKHPQFPAPVNQWFTMSYNLSFGAGGQLGRSVWVKTHDSVLATPTFLDPAMATGDIVAPDGEPAGWVMIFPGRADDPLTPDVLEGIGVATNSTGGEPVYTDGPFGQASYVFATTMSGVQYGIGLDPVNMPEFRPNDYFFGPLCMDGAVFETPCLIPDFTLSYVDDLESYQPISINLQTSRWFSPSTYTTISPIQNTTPGGAQSVGYPNAIGDNVFQLAFLTHLPPSAGSTPFSPLTVSAQLRVGPTARTGWAVRMQDSKRIGNHAATIILGGTDPTSHPLESDATIWVRQPNPNFDATNPSDDAQVQVNWIPPDHWSTPPKEELNLSHILVPTGHVVPTNQFQELRIGVQPRSADPDQLPTMRVFYGGAELFPFGNPLRTWVANSLIFDELQFWSGHEESGIDSLRVDDVFFNGAPAFMASGPNFISPFLDDFSGYPLTDTIDGHGFTWFLDAASVPDTPLSQNDPQLTIMPSPAFDPKPGEAVCRYELTEICLDELGVLPEVGSVIAVRHTSLPPLPDGSDINCPGAMGSSFANGVSFTVRTPDANVRIGVGKWALLNAEPVPYDPNSGDAIGFEYLFGYEPVWRVAEPQIQGVVTTDPVEGVNQVLRVINPGGIESTSGASNTYESVDALLPAVTAVRKLIPNPAIFNEMRFDLFIEGVGLDGQPANVAPRSRLILPIESVAGSRIASLIFGGTAFGNFTPDFIRFESNSGNEVSTGVSLVSGGEGVSGPLINTWFRVILHVDHNGNWEFFVDEDRDGPLEPVLVESRPPLDVNATDPDFATINAFRFEQGREIGGGEPVPLPVIVQSKPGGWQAIGPPDADPDDDYCFYSTVQEIFEHPTNPALIADVDTTLQGLVTGQRPLGPNQDVIAVLNRRLNQDNTVAGNSLVHDPCPPAPVTSDMFVLLDESGAVAVYEGRWQSLDVAPWTPQSNPRPAGGISRPDGPAPPVMVSYNDPTQEPSGFPATLAPRPIILVDWAMDEFDGVSNVLAPLPPSRWYVDNVSLRNVNGPAPCADLGGFTSTVDGADLAILLATWGPVPPEHPSDFNGDGIVNGSDLATLLANWGPCP